MIILQDKARFSDGFSELLGPEVLEVICLYGALCDAEKDPRNHVSNFRDLGPEAFVSQLVSEMEGAVGLSKNSRGTLNQRIQFIKQLKNYPRAGRPKADTANMSIWSCLWMLEHYEAYRPKFLYWSSIEFNSLALIFVSQAFGRLHYMIPSNTSLDEGSSSFSTLISLHQERRAQEDSRSEDVDQPELAGNPQDDRGLERRGDDLPSICLKLHCLSLRVMRAPGVRYGHRTFVAPCSETIGMPESGLRDYRELDEYFRRLGVPHDISFNEGVRQLRYFPEMEKVFRRWHTIDSCCTAIHFLDKALKTLGYQASVETLLEKPIATLANIYYTLAANRHCRVNDALPSPNIEGRLQDLPCPKKSNTGASLKQRGGQTKVSLTCKHRRPGASTCVDLVSIGLAFRQKGVNAINGADVDNDPVTLVRAYYSLFRTEKDIFGRHGRQADACIKCIRDAAAKDNAEYDTKWLVSKTEKLLSVDPLSYYTLDDRVRSCEKILKIKEFKELQPCLGTKERFGTVEKVLAILQFTDYVLKEKDFPIVRGDLKAQACYSVVCLLMLGFRPPEHSEYDLIDVFSKIIWEMDREGQQVK
jgi:hypothetical protein